MTWLGIAAAAFIIWSCARGYRRGFVREVVSLMFVMMSIVVVWVINPYVTDYLKNETPVYSVIQKQCEESISQYLEAEGGAGEEIQSAVIDKLPLPKAVKTNMADNNNSQVYQYLLAETFSEYLADYLAVMITNGIGFFLSYFLASMGIHIIARALNIIARLPVIRGFNHLAGIVVGGLRGILVVWIALLVMTIFCNTSWGAQCMSMIEKDQFLSRLYDGNLFVQVFLSIFYGK